MRITQPQSIVLAATGLALLSVAALADEYYSFRYDTPQPLTLDVTRVALYQPGGLARDSAAALAALGIDHSTLQPLAVEGWSLAPLPPALQHADFVPRIVDTLVDRGGFDFVSPVFLDDRGQPQLVTRHIMIGFAPGLSDHAAAALVSSLLPSADITRPWSSFPEMARIATGLRHGLDVLAVANALAALPSTTFAEPDWVLTGIAHRIPNDPLFGLLWGIHNTGQSGGVPDMDMDGPEAWDWTIGTPGIIVVVLDSGTQQNHPDLNLRAGADFTGQGTGGGPGNPCDNHGTAVAGCVSAIIDNGRGTVGIAPGSPVAAARFTVSNVPCDDKGTFQISWLVSALEWAQSIGARVTNNSLGISFSSSIDEAYANTKAAGLVHFASAGNDSRGQIGYPASSAYVNAVAALNHFGRRAWFSNWGSGLDFSAPGENILTTDRTGAAGYDPGDYVFASGTSLASPYAAGVAALVLSRNPGYTASQVEAILAQSCVDLGPGGYDTDFGWGFVNARYAVEATRSGIWADFRYQGNEAGSFLEPFNSLAEAVNAVPSGGTVILKPGTSSERLTISKPMSIRVWKGPATIGK